MRISLFWSRITNSKPNHLISKDYESFAFTFDVHVMTYRNFPFFKFENLKYSIDPTDYFHVKILDFHRNRSRAHPSFWVLLLFLLLLESTRTQFSKTQKIIEIGKLIKKLQRFLYVTFMMKNGKGSWANMDRYLPCMHHVKLMTLSHFSSWKLDTKIVVSSWLIYRFQ